MTRPIWVADCETDPFKEDRIPAPFIWGAYNGDEYHEFTSTREFVDFIIKGEKIVYAHNGGKFDWHYILDRLEPFTELMVIAGRLAKFQIGDAEFRDSYNILPMPLAIWQKDEFDYAIMEADVRHKPENWAKIRRYLRHDCEYLFEIVSEYIERYGLNLTQASSAMKTWQKISGVKAPSTSQSFYAFFSPFYYGGRVQCFQTGIIEKPFKVIDINSAYPYAMKHQHPWGNNYVVAKHLPNSRAYIQRSFIQLCGVSQGAFPWRTKTGLDFPCDNESREYFVTGWEFLAAIETGTLLDYDIRRVITFTDSIAFDDYVDHFYGLKTESKRTGDKAGYLFAKLFLNSLYGKFAANPEKYHEYMVIEPRYIQAAIQDDYDFAAELEQWALMSKALAEEKQRYYNVATAASITGFVRAYLWQAINQCEGVLYCDTDSIACDSTGKLPLDSATLGSWDIESECTFGAIAGKKLYAFRDNDNKWKTASKGVRLTPEEIIRVANGETVAHTPIAPSYSIKRGVGFITRNICKSA